MSDFPKPEAKEKRCYCPRCKHDTRVRGVIRRGDKFEMRAMIRELHETCTEFGEEIDELQDMLHDLTCTCNHEDNDKPLVIN